MVGTFGSADVRVRLSTPSARTEPASMFLTCGGTPSTRSWMRPASRSGMTPALPRYGTCTMSTPAARLNISVARWMPVPAPDEP